MSLFFLFILVNILGIAYSIYLSVQFSGLGRLNSFFSVRSGINKPGFTQEVPVSGSGIPFPYFSIGILYTILVFAILYIRLQTSLEALQIALLPGLLLSLYLAFEQFFLRKKWCYQRNLTILIFVLLQVILVFL